MLGKRAKKIIASLLTVSLLFGVTACGSSDSSDSASDSASSEEAESADDAAEEAENAEAEDSSASTSGDEETVLVMGIYENVETLNPWVSSGIIHNLTKYLLYETLACRQSGATELDYILMKDYTQVDSTTYDIEIYDYITDAEGNNITASDVVFSFEQYMEYWATNVESISVVDDYTVELVMNSAAEGSFEYIVCKVPIASETAYNNSEDGFSTTSCGTMPYTVSGGSDYVSGTTIIARKTDSYWQTDESLIYAGSVANADVIELDVIEEATQIALAIEQGTIDFAQYLDPQLLDEVSGEGNFEVFPLSSAEDRGILFNMMEDSPFYDNLALRQAVLYAIDNEAVAEACGYGYATASNIMTGDAELTIGYDSSWETSPYAYDPEKASELLAEAGYEPGELTITALSNSRATISTMWTVIQANLAEIGINMEISVLDGTTYGTYRDGSYGQYDLCYPGPGTDGYVTSDLWNTLFNRDNYASGRTMGGGLDDTLQELYDALTVEDGYTQENVNALYNYITDNALYYQIYSLPYYAAYNADVVESYFMDYNRFIRPNTVVLCE